MSFVSTGNKSGMGGLTTTTPPITGENSGTTAGSVAGSVAGAAEQALGSLMGDVQTRFNGTLHYTYTELGWLNSWRDNGPTHFHLRYDDEGRVDNVHK